MTMNVWRVDATSFTRSEFFDRIGCLALCELDLVVDELSSLVAATRFTLSQEARIYQAFDHAAALRTLHEGGLLLQDYLELQERYPHLHAIESKLFESKRVSREALMAASLKWLQTQEALPSVLAQLHEVVFEEVFEFSPCEVEILFRLAELSLPLRLRFSLDAKPRGLLLVLQDLLATFEARAADLPITIETQPIEIATAISPFFDAIFDDFASVDSHATHTFLAPSVRAEVDWVCRKIEKVRSDQPHASIAIAFRTMDSRVRWFENALKMMGVGFRVGSGLALNELPEAKALFRETCKKIDDGVEAGIEESQTFARHLIRLASSQSVGKLAPALRYIAQFFANEDDQVSDQDFAHWLKAFLEKRDVSFSNSSDADAVELVSVKQLWSRSYDHVFVVDLVQGRFPKTQSVKNPFADLERVEVNRIAGRRALPFIMDDPLEGSIVPTRQAYEPLWFVGAIRSAKQGLYLSASSLDTKGREQAQSEFLIAASRVVPFEAPEVEERTQNERVPYVNGSFQSDKKHFQEIFGRWLGLHAAHPLSPTRLESFAACPFRALIERIFGIERHRDADDADPRVAGRYVHAVLESFFKAFEQDHVNESGLSTRGREFLHVILTRHQGILEGEQASTKMLIRAQMLWLGLIVERAVSNLLKHPPVSGVQPRFFERGFGFDDKAQSLSIAGETVFLGGVVDRVDEGPNALAVIDYKMSSAAAIRQKVNEKSLFQTHFQLPLYARLLLSSLPQAKEKDIYAYLVSVRDGVCSQVLGRDLLDHVKERVLDDERDDGLAAGIRRVMTPILEGNFSARENETCSTCHLKSVCRI